MTRDLTDHSPRTAARPSAATSAAAALLALAIATALAGCGSLPGATISPPTGGIGSGIIDGSPGLDEGPAVLDLPSELVPPNTFIVDTRVADGALTVRMSSGLSEDELVDFFSRVIRELGAEPAVAAEGGGRRVTWDSDAAGSGEVRITQGTPTTIELVVRS